MKILKKILTVILCLVMFLSSAAAVTAYMLKDTLESSSVLGASIADVEYCDAVYDAVYDALERKMALVAISPEDISDVLTKDSISDDAPLACASLVDRIFGGEGKEWRYESEELRTKVTKLLEDYAGETGIEYEEGSADLVYGMICDTVSEEMGVISQIFVSKISPVFVKVRDLCGYWYVFAIIFVLSAAGVIFIGRKHVKNALYNAILPTYLAMFTLCVTSWILYSKDYLAKTVLASETFQHFLRQMYRIILGDIAKVTTILTAMLLVMAITVITAMALRRHGRGKHRKSHTEDASAQ